MRKNYPIAKYPNTFAPVYRIPVGVGRVGSRKGEPGRAMEIFENIKDIQQKHALYVRNTQNKEGI